MKHDRIKWNKKHAEKGPGQMVPDIVRKYIHHVPPGRALDIACGTGAVSRFLAQNGYHVHAVDISDVALAALSKQHPNIQAICADLDTFDLPVGRYSLITNLRYLNRRLFPQIIKALLPGGLLIFETYMKSPNKALDRGFKREYLLDTNELRKAFAALDILYYVESASQDEQTPARLATLVATKPIKDSGHG
jgi:tellurite methyltransferase